MAKKKNNSKSTPNRNLPNGWFYMSPEEIDVGKLQKAVSLETEIWREAGVLEVIVEPKVSIDIETCDLDLGDDYSNDFIASNGVRSLFYVSFKQDAYDLCIPALKEILAAYGGMFCGDTNDFTPVIKL